MSYSNGTSCFNWNPTASFLLLLISVAIVLNVCFYFSLDYYWFDVKVKLQVIEHIDQCLFNFKNRLDKKKNSVIADLATRNCSSNFNWECQMYLVFFFFFSISTPRCDPTNEIEATGTAPWNIWLSCQIVWKNVSGAFFCVVRVCQINGIFLDLPSLS